MKRKDHTLWQPEGGEILYRGLNRDSRLRYRADTPFDCGIAPYLVMLFCAAVDGAVFYSLFSAISYDSPLMLTVQIAGFLFGFDVVPIYIGIHLRRVRQGLSADRFPLWLALGVCIVVCAMNAGLRIATIDELEPKANLYTSFLGTPQPEAEEGISSTAAALTVFGIGIPMVTSAGSFFISYLTYDPLKVRRRRLEELIAQKRDEIRRFEAILADYDAESDFAARLVEDDLGKFEQMRQLQRAVVLGHCDYVRQRLKEHLANPTANNILSKENCAQLLARLDREMGMLEMEEVRPAANVIRANPKRRIL